VFAVGELPWRAAGRGHDEELGVHAKVGEEVNRLTVLRPDRAVDIERLVLADDHARRASGGGGDEQPAVVVGLEACVRSGDEQHAPVVG